VCVSRVARAWEVVGRLYPKIVPTQNPFRQVIRETDKQDIIPATREEAYALSEAIAKMGHPHRVIEYPSKGSWC
jgi:hypothetical protein